MEKSDVWDDAPLPNRGDQRYRTRWRVTLTFDPALARAVVPTTTHEISLTGLSVQCPSDEALGSVVGLLLRPAPINGVEQRVITLTGKVVSSTAFQGSFRLGIVFFEDAGLDHLYLVLDNFDLSGDTLPSDPNAESLPSLL